MKTTVGILLFMLYDENQKSISYFVQKFYWQIGLGFAALLFNLGQGRVTNIQMCLVVHMEAKL